MHSIFYYSNDLSCYDFGPDHPFKPERAQKTLNLCRRYGTLFVPNTSVQTPSKLAYEKLLLAHSEEYLDVLQRISKGEIFKEMFKFGIGTEDNPPLPGIYDWSVGCAGATWGGIMEILKGNAEVAFNPLGGYHHALRSSASGFCYINDIVIAIRDALNYDKGIKIAYLDIDAHHGDAVQKAFYEEDRVLFISMHESGENIYPFTGFARELGEGKGKGFNINIPFPPGTDDEIYMYAFYQIVVPSIRRFQPDLLFTQVGADSIISDPLTDFMLTNNSYVEIIKQIKTLCLKVLATGGGGYDIYRTARCWTLAWSILNDLEPKDEFAGLVGGMMFGPEMEVSSLYDRPYIVKGPKKEKIRKQVEKTVKFLFEKLGL